MILQGLEFSNGLTAEFTPEIGKKIKWTEMESINGQMVEFI
jgi:hypothetical protein